jgi:hypothetical protein
MGERIPSTPDMKRRANRLILQDQQWDALFLENDKSCLGGETVEVVEKGQSSSPILITPSRARRHSRRSDNGGNYHAEDDRVRVTAAHMMAEAKLLAMAAVASSPRTPAAARTVSPRQRRSIASSRDEIFRIKRHARDDDDQSEMSSAANYGCHDFRPVHRFLGRPLANTLCFATPIRDSKSESNEQQQPARLLLLEDDDGENSLVSASARGAAAQDHHDEETISSTLYYEATKLAEFSERHAPMPLFPDYTVTSGQDIQGIMSSKTHCTRKDHRFATVSSREPPCSDEGKEIEFGNPASSNSPGRHEQTPQLAYSTESSQNSTGSAALLWAS